MNWLKRLFTKGELEYQCVFFTKMPYSTLKGRGGDEISKFLNLQAKEGWKLTHVNGDYYYFKRIKYDTN